MKLKGLLWAAISLLLISCTPLTGNKDKPGNNDKEFVTTLTDASEDSLSIKCEYTGKKKIYEWEASIYESDDIENSSHLDWNYSYSETAVFTFPSYGSLKADYEYTVQFKVIFDDFTEHKFVRKFSTTSITVPDFRLTAYNGIDSRTHKLKNYVSVEFYKDFNDAIKRIELCRSESKNGNFTPIAETSYPRSNTRFNDDTIRPETTYFYKVIAYTKNSSGEEIFLTSSEIKEITTKPSYPEPVVISDDSITRGITTLSVKWTESEGAEKYKVIITTDAFIGSGTEVFSAETTGTSYLIRNLEPGTKYRVFVNAVSNAGESPSDYYTATTGKPSFFRNGYTSSSVTVKAGQTNATYSAPVDFSDTTDCVVKYTLRVSSDENSEILMDNIESPKFIRENLSPATYYSSSSANKQGYLHMTVIYKNSTGEEVIKTDSLSVNTFTTTGLNPPSNLRVDSSTKNTATVSFTELSNEEKFGKIPEYIVTAYDNKGSIVSNASGTTSPVTVTGLRSGSEYTFTVYTTFTGAGSSAEIETSEVNGNTASGIVEKPVITLSEVQPGADEAYFRGVYTYIQASWNALSATDGVIPEDLVYGLEYKIFEKSKYTRPRNLDKEDVTYSGTGSFSKKFLVNGGNQYTVRAYAFDKNEPTDIVYSEPQVIQLQKIEDRNLFSALTYTSDFSSFAGAREGDVVEFTNPKVWETEKEIRSVQGMYNIGYIQLFGQVEATKYKFPKVDGLAYCSMKFNFTNALSADSIPRLILIDRAAFSFQVSTYSDIDEAYYLIPNEQGTILQTFEKVWQDFNMPFFNNGSTSTKPSSAGRQIDEEYMFNNSIYLGVKQTKAGDIGFSYYY